MKITIKLQDLLQQNESAITATTTLLSQKLAVLDSTGVSQISITKTPTSEILKNFVAVAEY